MVNFVLSLSRPFGYKTISVNEWTSHHGISNSYKPISETQAAIKETYIFRLNNIAAILTHKKDLVRKH